MSERDTKARQSIFTVQHAVVVRSSSGARTRTWEQVGQLFGREMASPRGEGLQANQIAASKTVRVRVNWRACMYMGVKAGDFRLSLANLYANPPTVIVYDVEGVTDPKGDRRDMDLTCTVRDAAGERGGNMS